MAVFSGRYNTQFRDPKLKYYNAPVFSEFMLPAAVDTGGLGIVCVNAIKNGYDLINRIGDAVTLHSVTISGIIEPRQTGNINGDPWGEPGYARMLVVYDACPNGEFPTAGATKVIGTGIDGGVASAWTRQNPYYMDRFLILRDMEWFMPETVFASSVGAAPALFHFGSEGNNKIPFAFNEYIPIKNLITRYTSNDDNDPEAINTIADIVHGSLLVILVSNFSNTYIFDGDARVTYYDC